MNNSIIADKNKVPAFDRYLPKSEPSSLFLEDTNSDEVIDIIKEFKTDKSSDIPIIVVKHCVPVIAYTLCKLYNKCIHAGTFPSILKHGRITPVFKKGRKDDINNYRPISTLPIFGKIFEKILYKRIYSFMISKNIISDTQFGFRMNHSISHAIHHSVSFIKKSHADKKHVIGIFIDLSKAFDTIDHKTLLRKLYNYGLRGSAQDLVSDYLCNRYQRVKIHDEESDNMLVEFGVRQGSVLGPLLFLLYINDLKNVLSDTKSEEIILYADDTNIFTACNSLSEAVQAANQLLHKVNNYMISNFLHINKV